MHLLPPAPRALSRRRHVWRRGISARPLRTFLVERYPGWTVPGVDSLTSSEMEPLSLRELLLLADDDCKRRWDELSLGYPAHNEGSVFLREEIASQYAAIGLDEVNVVAPQEGIYLAMRALLAPTDHVIVTTPCYQSLYEVALSVGCEVSQWMPRGLEHGEPPRSDTADLAAQLREKAGRRHMIAAARRESEALQQEAARLRRLRAVQEAEQRHAAAEARVKAAHATQIRTLLRQLDGVESQLEQRIERIETVHRAFSAAGRRRRAPGGHRVRRQPVSILVVPTPPRRPRAPPRRRRTRGVLRLVVETHQCAATARLARERDHDAQAHVTAAFEALGPLDAQLPPCPGPAPWEPQRGHRCSHASGSGGGV